MGTFHQGDTGLPPGSTPRTFMVARRFTLFPPFSTPEGERHTKKANHLASSDNTPVYPLKQNEHTRRASLFYIFDSHATHARNLQPEALVFVSHGFVLVEFEFGGIYKKSAS